MYNFTTQLLPSLLKGFLHPITSTDKVKSSTLHDFLRVRGSHGLSPNELYHKGTK